MTSQENITLLQELRKQFERLLVSIEQIDEEHGKEDELRAILQLAQQKNPWFTLGAVKSATESWVQALNDKDIEKWTRTIRVSPKISDVGVIMAGNIPFVGLHDALSVLLTGHQLRAKLSSKDEVLMSWILKEIGEKISTFQNRVTINEPLKGIDYLIATGTDNSARYFESYFKEVPKIIRKNRTSLAVLDGNESDQDLRCLADDVFLYFGLGCRNVTKVYLPENYDLDQLFNAFFSYQDVINHHKYANNYDYNKAVYLLNKVELIENGFLLMKEDQGLHSPLAVLFYEFYNDSALLNKSLKDQSESIQCVVSNFWDGAVKFGEAQQPKLWDYADGINTIEFLSSRA